MTQNGNKTETKKQFEISRVFNAPREVVFKACTEKEQLAHWWGAKGFALDVVKLEVKPGGVFHYSMTANKMQMFGKWVFEEIKVPEKIVFISSFSDKDCGITRHPGAAEWPLETRSIMAFAAENGGTRLTITAYPINASNKEQETFEAGFDSMKGGFGGTLDQLEEHLKTLATKR